MPAPTRSVLSRFLRRAVLVVALAVFAYGTARVMRFERQVELVQSIPMLSTTDLITTVDHRWSNSGKDLITLTWVEPWAAYSVLANFDAATETLLSTTEVYHHV
jgi:hypothetical protein